MPPIGFWGYSSKNLDPFLAHCDAYDKVKGTLPDKTNYGIFYIPIRKDQGEFYLRKQSKSSYSKFPSFHLKGDL